VAINQVSLPNFDEWWDYNKPQETEQIFREVLPLAEESTNVAYYIELLTQIARAQGLQGNFGQGHETLDRARKLLDPTFQRPRVRYLLERGRLYNSSQNPDDAAPLFLEAFDVALEAGEESLAVDAAHMIAIVKPLDQKLEWNLRAMEIAETASEEKARGWLGSLYNNIGYTYLEQKAYDSALAYFEKLLAFCIERDDDTFAAIASWFIAKTYRLMGDPEAALARQLALLEQQDAAGEKSAYTYEELGECYLALGDDDNRRKFFALAYDAFLSDPQYNFVVRYEKDRIDRLKELSE
jgi:tetratricopeptide (TPR) repeat protein